MTDNELIDGQVKRIAHDLALLVVKHQIDGSERSTIVIKDLLDASESISHALRTTDNKGHTQL